MNKVLELLAEAFVAITTMSIFIAIVFGVSLVIMTIFGWFIK